MRGSSNHVGDSGQSPDEPGPSEEAGMSKRARKRRDRNKKGANHGKKPNT